MGEEKTSTETVGIKYEPATVRIKCEPAEQRDGQEEKKTEHKVRISY
jgi:hypothetical protein